MPRQTVRVLQRTDRLNRPWVARRSGRKRPNVSTVLAAAHVATEKRNARLTKEDLVGYLKKGCKPRNEWRMGVEHEKFGFTLDTHQRMTYEHVQYLLNALERRFGAKTVSENGKVIEASIGKQSITLEPGGQFELSGEPLETVHQVGAELVNHLYQVKTIGEDIGVGFLGMGFDPVSHLEEVPEMPKDRYRLMKKFLPQMGSTGMHTMYRTCTAQVNLDFESEQDMVQKFRIGLALQPVAVALFANSPFVDGKPNGMSSNRAALWTNTAEDRCGNLPFVFEESFGFEGYVDWAISIPMYYVYHEGKYVDAIGQSWGDFMEGNLPALPGKYATLSDWSRHLGCVYPEVRMKKFLEFRGADCGSWRMICALPAFWAGLVYDDKAQSEALKLISSWTQEDRDYMRHTVPKHGLSTEWRGKPLRKLAAQVLDIAKRGLQRRGKEEEGYLKPLEAIVATSKTESDRAVELFHTQWGGSVDGLFEEWRLDFLK